MIIHSAMIPLRTVKYTDSRSIVSCLSREAGRVSLIVADGAGREARRRRALMMPGAAFTARVDVRGNRSLQTLSDVMPVRPAPTDHPVKMAVTLFVCDFINTLLEDSMTDTVLYDYVDGFMADLSARAAVDANAPICFVVGMAAVMGIAPDMQTWRAGRCFDFAGGVFRDTPPLTGRYLSPEESAVAALVARMHRRNMHCYRFSRAERAGVLDTLLQYMAQHLGRRVATLRSLEVLHALFD